MLENIEWKAIVQAKIDERVKNIELTDTRKAREYFSNKLEKLFVCEKQYGIVNLSKDKDFIELTVFDRIFKIRFVSEDQWDVFVNGINGLFLISKIFIQKEGDAGVYYVKFSKNEPTSIPYMLTDDSFDEMLAKAFKPLTK